MIERFVNEYFPSLMGCFGIGFLIGALCVLVVVLPLILRERKARQQERRWAAWWIRRGNRA
jgi:hypothetical protein